MKNYCFKKQNFNFFVLLILILFSGFCGSFLLNFNKETSKAVFYIRSVIEVKYDGSTTNWKHAVQDTYTVNGYTLQGANGTYGVDSGTSNRYDWSEVWINSGSTSYTNWSENDKTNSWSAVQFKLIWNNFRSTYYDITATAYYAGDNASYKTKGTATYSGQSFDIGGDVGSAVNDRIYCKGVFNIVPKSFAATFYISKNKVSQNAIGGSAAIKYGTNVSLSQQVQAAINFTSYTGYHADGWYDENFKKVSSLVIYSTAPKFYYNFAPNNYTVTYYGNGSTSGSTSSQSFTYDSAQSLRANGYTKTGYTFTGWNTKEDGSGTSYSAGQSVKNLTSDNNGTVKLYAQWTKNNYKVDINFYKPDGATQNGGTFDLYNGSGNLIASGLNNEPSNPYVLYQDKWILKNIKGSVGTHITDISLGTNSGYGALTKSKDSNGTTWTCTYTASDGPKPTGGWDNIIKIFTANNILTLKYYVDGVNVSNTTHQYPANNVELKKVEKTGYQFLGWTIGQEGSGSFMTGVKDFSSNIADDDATIQLYANWAPITYNISYNLNGGTNGSSAPISGTFDNTITISNPTRTGYTFTGWTANGLDTSTAYCGLNQWTDSSIKVSETSFKNLRSTSGTVTIIANWNANKYTVQYNGNGNTGGSTASQTFTYDQTSTLQYNGFTKTGYVFIGWNTQANGSGTSYIAGQSVKNLTSINGGTVTLYAQWQATWVSGGIKEPEKDSENEYYLISSADELAWLAYQTETYGLAGQYKQIANIDLSDKIWLPIGRMKSFTGEYDGQGYKIIGLKTSDVKDANGQYLESYGGLFGQITNSSSGSTAKIYNLYIENANISGKTAGIIAGSVSDNVVIENCIVSGIVNGKTIGSVVGVGGQINNCLAINVNTSAVGNSATIQNCIYQLINGSKGKVNFNDYSGWGDNENLSYPIPKSIAWYPYNQLTSATLEEWLNK